MLKIDAAVKGLNCSLSVLISCGRGVTQHICNHVKDALAVLTDIQNEISSLESGKMLAESERDSLLMAIAGTAAGRPIDITAKYTHDIIDAAITCVRVMDAQIKQHEALEEIPFGAVEQDKTTMQLEQRIGELELLLATKVDEQKILISNLREFANQWVEMANAFNRIDYKSLNNAVGKLFDAL
ncbi:hypothetical protein [Edaphovirga cremea]|uniref:hypothetical protein n=1 Tax=Edaphovirga cremea TaxID=2267246 RepID=UPI003989FBEE